MPTDPGANSRGLEASGWPGRGSPARMARCDLSRGEPELLSVCYILGLMIFQDAPVIKVNVGMDAPQRHFYEIEMVFPKSKNGERILKMPVWTPGSYKVRDFAKNVEAFQAFNRDDRPLSWKKLDKASWLIEVPPGTVFKVRYRIFAYQFSVRDSYLDHFYGFLNPASAFFYEELFKQSPFRIQVKPFHDWLVASSLEKIGPNLFEAANYDDLVDSPFQFGTFRRHEFTVRGIPHQWLIAGDVNMNEAAMVQALKTIGETVGDLFGSYPFKHYTIFSQFRIDGVRGGLEHHDSTMVQAASDQFRTKKGWDRFLGLVLHEYFHAWNAKAIHDRVLGPFDYQRETYSDLLWLHEGWTDYYDTVLMSTAGFWDEKEALKDWARQLQASLNKPGKNFQSLTEASFDAWIHQYQPSKTSHNSQTSYYREGALSALGLDLLMRHKSKNTLSLDDVMRTLWQEYALTGTGIDWISVVNCVENLIGKPGKDYLENHIRDSKPLPFETLLGYAGVEMVFVDQDREAGEDAEASPKNGPYAPNPKSTMDIEIEKRNGSVFVKQVNRGGTGWKAGLDFGDEILAINERRVHAENYENILGWSQPGDEVTVFLARAGKILSIPVKLEPHPKKLTLVPQENAGSLQKEIFTSVFGGVRTPKREEG